MSKRIQIHLRIKKHKESIWEVEEPFLSYTSNGKKLSFDCFDSILWKEDNRQVYLNHVKDSVIKFLEGQSLTVFAYGQTGSGKTHTMLGGKENGLVQIALEDILPSEVEMSFIEIFNEKIFDLSLKSEVKLFSKENSCILQGLHIEKVSNYSDALGFIVKCLENRKSCATDFNSSSSRSHAILKIRKDNAILTFIDLAGSEKSSTNHLRRKEAAYINKSLLSLGKLVNDMLNNKFLSFRDSKLTRILQDSISQQSSMIAFCMICSTQDSLSESLGTINFAGRLSNLNVHIAKTEDCVSSDTKICKVDFYKIQTEEKLRELEELTEKVIKRQKLKDMVIECQRERIESLEEMIKNLLKQINDKKREEVFLLEKQLYRMKISEEVEFKDQKHEKESDIDFTTYEDTLLDYLEN